MTRNYTKEERRYLADIRKRVAAATPQDQVTFADVIVASAAEFSKTRALYEAFREHVTARAADRPHTKVRTVVGEAEKKYKAIFPRPKTEVQP